MAFNDAEVSELLAACHRRCCICHRYCGIKMEIDHMQPKGQKGSDDIENAIPVCFECHAEIHLYNDQHPRGREFRVAELKLHKQQWLAICKENPVAIIDSPRATDIGPLHSLIDELEFNQGVAAEKDSNAMGCPFEVRQFDRCVEAGLVSILTPEVRDAMLTCYRLLKQYNERLRRAMSVEHPAQRANALSEAQKDLMASKGPTKRARDRIEAFLTAQDDNVDSSNADDADASDVNA